MIASEDRSAASSPETHGLRAKARLALARRDLLEFIRDRRTLFVTLLLPMAMYPILALSSALGVRTALSDIDSRTAPTNLVIVLSGSPWDAQALAERVGGLPRPEEGRAKLDWPASVSFGFGSAEEARNAVEAGDADLWIDVPEQVLDQLDGIGTIAIEAQGPDTKVLTPRVREQFTAVMRSLADDARRRRIDRASLPETLLEPVTVSFTGKIDPPGTISTRSILPTVAGGVFVLLAVLTMTGAFYPAIDAIAGEKERGTIETLLIAPCAAIDIVAGKFLAVWAVALATLVANVVSIALTTAVSLRFLPQGGRLLPEGHLPIVVGVSLLAFIGLSAVAAAMCLAVTTASKSGKEAQNTLTPVLLIASALAGAGLVIDPGRTTLLPAVPFAGQVALARATLEPDERPALLPSAPMDGTSQSRPAGLPERIAATGLIERLALPLAVSLILAHAAGHGEPAHRRRDSLSGARRRWQSLVAARPPPTTIHRAGVHGAGHRPGRPLVCAGHRTCRLRAGDSRATGCRGGAATGAADGLAAGRSSPHVRSAVAGDRRWACGVANGGKCRRGHARGWRALRAGGCRAPGRARDARVGRGAGPR